MGLHGQLVGGELLYLVPHSAWARVGSTGSVRIARHRSDTKPAPVRPA
jgi:hypothetical protein